MTPFSLLVFVVFCFAGVFSDHALIICCFLLLLLLFFCCPIICADLRGTAPSPLVPASPTSGHTQDSFRIVNPPQRSTGSDVRSLVGCHPKETLHCCWVTLVVFSSTCSDSTYAGHHLLCPLLTTVLAKLRIQTEWASPQRADRRYVPSPILLCGLSDAEGFDQNCQGRRPQGRRPRLLS